MDVVDLCTRERPNTKGKFFTLTHLTLSAVLLKDVPMGCKDSVLLEPLLKNQKVNCLTYEPNKTENHTKTNLAYSEHLLSICLEMRDSK